MAIYKSYSGEIATMTDRYIAQGRKEARENRPPSNATTPDEHEAALAAEASKWMGVEQYLLDTVVTEASKSVTDARQKAIDLESRVERMLNDSTLQAGVEADLQGERTALVSASVARLSATRELNFFRQENDIREAANYPESRVMHLAIIVALSLAETLMNAVFYENAQGLIGGFVVALAISVVLMGASLGLGYGFRFKNLKAASSKVTGWACLIAFIVLSVWANAVFAAFRGEYQLLTDPTDAMQLREAFQLASAEAKNVFKLNMQFSDLMSLILFGLGFLLSCVAFYKGYTFDDKYPGHGAKDRAVKAAAKVEDERRSLVLQKVKELLQRRRAEMDAAMHEPGQLIGRAAAKAGDLQHAKKTLEIQARAIQGDYKRVLGAYRGANVAVRAVEKPAFFDTYPDLTSQVNPSAADASLEDLQAVQEEVKRLRDSFKEELNRKLEALAGQSASILNQTFSSFIRSVEKESQEVIDRSARPVHAAA
jgi:hypothetical protein